MQIVFIITTNNSKVEKPPMTLVFTVWKEASAFIAHFGFQEIKELDVFDDIISSEGLSFERETNDGDVITINVKAGTMRGMRAA